MAIGFPPKQFTLNNSKGQVLPLTLYDICGDLVLIQHHSCLRHGLASLELVGPVWRLAGARASFPRCCRSPPHHKSQLGIGTFGKSLASAGEVVPAYRYRQIDSTSQMFGNPSEIV